MTCVSTGANSAHFSRSDWHGLWSYLTIMKHPFFAPLSRVMAIVLVVATAMSSNKADLADREYISEYHALAFAEEGRAGIPATIKLAQALVESSGGRSVLATRANNHFGIKCKSYWTGKRYFYTDDDRDADGNLVPSCFRMYESVESSYRDHSDFLATSERYASLFEIDKTDYESWANGLLKCGYATDPGYAKKLIRIIERYGLDKLDEPR